jgi:hypothetical protein
VLESGSAAGILPLVVGGLELGWWEMADGLQEPAVVEPVDPLQGGVLDLIKTLPGATPADQLGLVRFLRCLTRWGPCWSRCWPSGSRRSGLQLARADTSRRHVELAPLLFSATMYQ